MLPAVLIFLNIGFPKRKADSHLTSEEIKKVFEIFFALLKGWRLQLDNMQPEVKIRAELFFEHKLLRSWWVAATMRTSSQRRGPNPPV